VSDSIESGTYNVLPEKQLVYHAGISAYKPKDTTVKETRPTSNYLYSFTHKKSVPELNDQSSYKDNLSGDKW